MLSYSELRQPPRCDPVPFSLLAEGGLSPVDSMLKMMGEVEYKQQDGKGPLMVMCE